jgi:hypothetical protein
VTAEKEGHQRAEDHDLQSIQDRLSQLAWNDRLRCEGADMSLEFRW